MKAVSRAALGRLCFGAALLYATAAHGAGPDYYKPGTFPPEVTKEERAALLLFSTKYLPPPEYDYPNRRAVVVIEAKSQEDLKKLCRNPSNPKPMAGCADAGREEYCLIYHAPKEELALARVPLSIVLRHENAHCNGWPNDHPGVR
jgi:hypothetical protein